MQNDWVQIPPLASIEDDLIGPSIFIVCTCREKRDVTDYAERYNH